jgi:glycyl-tRNA synthetase beta chain
LGTLSLGEHFETLKGQILRFFEGRLETVYSDLGYSTDLVQSVLTASLHVPLFDIRERLDALKRFKDHTAYPYFLSAIKRVNNIIPKSPVPPVRPELLLEEQELRLKAKLDSVDGELAVLMGNRRYDDAIILLSSLTEEINLFFDHILVMDKREEIKLNRLSLLQQIWTTVSTLADFSKISSH